jgi:hypothetical protein
MMFRGRTLTPGTMQMQMQMQMQIGEMSGLDEDKLWVE